MIDTNVLIAAMKNPMKEGRTLQLILNMIKRENLRIVGDHHLLKEMFGYAQRFESKFALDLVWSLLGKMEVIYVGKNLKRACKDYFETPRKADVLHAATCLKADAILITNDKDFDRIRDEGIIEVWSISEAIKKLL
jgi:predicted nucleic acid-binding protein